MAFVRAVAAAYARYGLSPEAALQHARIAPGQLTQADARVTAAQFEALSAFAMRELDDEALGWFGRRLPWGSYGLLCRASVTAPTLGIALKRWCRQHRLLTDDVLLQFATGTSGARLCIDECRPLGELREFCLVTLLRNVLGFASWAIDSRIALRETAFPFPPPPHGSVYPLLFSGPVRFDAEAAGLVFDPSYLALPLVRDEAATRAMLQRALPLIVLPYRRDRLLVQQARQALAAHPARIRNADDLAALLHLSTRTLHRHLRDEGASLQQLKDQVRCERAKELLLRSDRPVKQVALAAGFRSEKSFLRAFRHWTGQSPGEFRQAAGGRPS
jgi:AraC-like DNA-binding protein